MDEQNRKRKQLTLEEKKRIFEDLDSGMKKKDVAQKYMIKPSTLSTILKAKEKIKLNLEGDVMGPERKRIRTGYHVDIDKAVYKWFLEARSNDIQVNGSMLCEQARAFARALNLNEFRGSTGWLHNFRKRYISHRTFDGEESAEPFELATSWNESHAKNLIQENENSDVSVGDLRNCPRKFLSEFIDLYKALPCLWNIKSKEYSNRTIKKKAYDKMIKKLKEVDSAANKVSVVRKIDSLRGTFRKEWKKKMQSTKSGEETENAYKPRLWYFEKLLFLKGQETPSESLSSVFNNGGDEATEDEITLVEVDPESVMSPSSSRSGTPPTKPRKKVICAKTWGNNMVKQKQQDKPDDEYDVIGKNIAHKLRSLSKETKTIAEKFITDVLFECEMGNINKYTKQSFYQMSSPGKETPAPVEVTNSDAGNCQNIPHLPAYP